LRVKKQAAAVDEVGKNTTGKREEEAGCSGPTPSNTLPQCRIGELEHEPALGHSLHPGAHIRKKRSNPENTIIAM